MRLLSLDYDPVYGADNDRSWFGSDTSVFDYDAVIWDPAQSLRYYNRFNNQLYRGLPALGDDMSVALKADIARRRTEFNEFVTSGRILITVVRPPQVCYIDTGRSEYSGTGRNRVRTRIVESEDLWSTMPVADLSVSMASGNRITVQGDTPLAAFLRKHKSLIRYEAVLSWPIGTPVTVVTGTKRVVGSYVRTKAGGLLALLPALDLLRSDDDDDDDGDEDHWIDQGLEVQEDLLHAIGEMTAKSPRSRPPWSLKYATVEQSKLRQEIVRQESRVEAARTELATLIERRDKSEARNQLYLGTGDGLALEVKLTLELLGGEVTQPDPERDDWKVAFPEGNAVVEVKGVSKSAAEKHAAQLEKWVAGEFEETGIAPKGILVINTWRDVDLTERSKNDFPSQMIPYCERRGHCLISGLQMFSVRMEVEADPSRAAHWRSRILETSGVLQDVADWKAFLETTEDRESP